MKDLEEYIKANEGAQVLVSTLKGKIEGVLSGGKFGDSGNVESVIIRQYLHRTEIPVREILNVRNLK